MDRMTGLGIVRRTPAGQLGRKLFGAFAQILVLCSVLLLGSACGTDDAARRPAQPRIDERTVRLPAAVPGETIEYLIDVRVGSQPREIVMIMPGSPGVLRYDAGNFLVRSRQDWVDDETAVAVVDAPSDMQGGLTDTFRASKRHADELRAIAIDLKAKFPGGKIVLVGTSAGTVSTALAGRAIQDQLDAVVHTSTVASEPPLRSFAYDEIKVRQLMVHHVQDGCRHCRYGDAKSISTTFNIPLISVEGGRAEGDPCQAMGHHGFRDREAPVIVAIKQWLRGDAYPATIE
jgi:hypothetical protein